MKKESLTINDYKKAIALIKKYTHSGGWSGDYTTEYWKMKKDEIALIDKLFTGVPVESLSGALKEKKNK